MKKCLFFASLLFTPSLLFAQKIQITEAPETYQLYARDESDSAVVAFKGTFDHQNDSGKILLKVWKDGELYDTKRSDITTSSFRLSSTIRAGLYQYNFKLYKVHNGREEAIFSADSIVCGDAYIITGQSNSHPSSSKAVYSNPYCRSFGVKTGYEAYSQEDRQVRWGRATGNCPDLEGVGGWFTRNKFGVGVWGMELMRLIVEKHKMPVCVINGGSGSSSIEENMLYPEVPSLETSFGRLAYRVDQAGLKNKVKAIFWHQGETNSDGRHTAYASNFDILYDDWHRVYSGIEKIYLFQLHPGCGGDFQSELRETQCQLALKYERVDIMSTTAIAGHDGCHFSHEGYLEFAQRIFPLVSRDFYGRKPDHMISPPKLLNVHYEGDNEIVLQFDQPVELEEQHKVGDNTFLLRDQFFFRNEWDEDARSGMVREMLLNGNHVTLKVKGESLFKYLTWLPNVNYQDTELCYQGPWIIGKQNWLGALSFDRRPISMYDAAHKNFRSTWNGFEMLDSTLNGVPYKVVFPRKANQKRDWIWRARFWGHEPQTDLALLERGFHLAYIDVGGLFGNEQAIRRWDEFYSYMTGVYGLNQKVVLEGMSRGGLIIYNWGNRNADKVACIYGDAPVCDFKSWPGGKGIGKGSPSDWEVCLEQYGFTEEIALNYNGNPINHMENLAKMKVPILNVVGDADQVVPVSENTSLLEQRLKDLGWTMEVIHKPGTGHHPHSLKDPAPIVEFILKSTDNL